MSVTRFLIMKTSKTSISNKQTEKNQLTELISNLMSTINFHYLQAKKPFKQLTIFTTVAAGSYIFTQMCKTYFGIPSTTPNNEAEMVTFHRPIDVRDPMSFDWAPILPEKPKRD